MNEYSACFQSYDAPYIECVFVKKQLYENLNCIKLWFVHLKKNLAFSPEKLYLFINYVILHDKIGVAEPICTLKKLMSDKY